LKAKLKIKCKNCGNWDVIEVEKIFLNASDSATKLQVFLPAYQPLRTEKCSRCNQVIAKEKRIIGAKKK
jgi:hypothetical protein